jgi:hypothetical protein
MKFASLTVLGLVTAAGIVMASQGPMRPGQWETTMQLQMANMPMQMPEMKSTTCITPEQIEKDPTSGLPKGMQGGSGQDACKVSDYKVEGDTMSWKVACPASQMTGSGEITFSGDTYTGTMKAATPQGEMTMKMNGKRLGDCTVPR